MSQALSNNRTPLNLVKLICLQLTIKEKPNICVAISLSESKN